MIRISSRRSKFNRNTSSVKCSSSSGWDGLLSLRKSSIGSTTEALFERPAHTFVGYFIGSPGMNIMAAKLNGASVQLGAHSVHLASAPRFEGQPKLEFGVRPEFVRLGAQGIPATLSRVEDAGRYRVAHLTMDGNAIAALLREGDEIPASPHITFDPIGVHLYADSWRVDVTGAGSEGAGVQ